MIIHLTKKISGIWNDQKAKIQKVFVAFLFLSAFFLRIHYINRPDLGFDETFSVITISKNWDHILQLFERDVHPPLHTIILKLWALVFGNTEMAVRMLSVVFGMGTLVVVYQLSKKIFNNARYSLMTLALAAVNPLLIYYSQEARSYSMLIFFSTSAIFFAFYSNSRFKNILLLFNLLAGMYTHYIFFFIVGSIYAIKTLQIYNLASGTSIINCLKKIFKLKYFIFTSILVVAYLPWLNIFLKQFTMFRNEGFWLPAFNPLVDVLLYVQQFFTGHILTIPQAVLSLMLICLIPLLGSTLTARGVYFECKEKKHLPVLSLFLLLSIGGIYIISFWYQIFYVRYLSFATPTILLLIVYGIATLAERNQKNSGNLFYYTLIVATITFLFCNIFPGLQNNKARARDAIHYIEQNKKTSQLIIHPTEFTFLPFKHYAPNQSFLYKPSETKLYYKSFAITNPTDYFKGDLKSYHYLWVVSEALAYYENNKLEKFLINQGFNKQETKFFPNVLKLELWGLRDEN